MCPVRYLPVKEDLKSIRIYLSRTAVKFCHCELSRGNLFYSSGCKPDEESDSLLSVEELPRFLSALAMTHVLIPSEQSAKRGDYIFST